MDFSSFSDPYKAYLHYPTPETGTPEAGKYFCLEEYYPARHSLVEEEVKNLFQRAFQTKILFGQRHYAASATWRDEHVVSRSDSMELSRFAVRVHVFANNSVNEKEMVPGRYLGFVALRPDDEAPGELGDAEDGLGYDYVVEAEVTGPAHMQRPRYHLIMTTSSSARLGVLPFRSAVYMAPRRSEDRGSTCVHLAVSQALHLIMSRFGCRPISQREFDAYVWQLRCKKAENAGGDGPELGTVANEGAQLEEALEVLKRCSAGGFIEVFPSTTGDFEDAMPAAWRCLTDVLANGLPVVMMVNHRELTSQSAPDNPHAQLVFGMRLMHCPAHMRQMNSRYPKESEPGAWMDREDLAELPGQFVGHDVLMGPYFECPAYKLLRAAWEAAKDEPGIYFLAIGPKDLNVPLSLARNRAELTVDSLRSDPENEERKLLDAYMNTKAGLAPWYDRWLEGVVSWRYVARLLTRPEFENRYPLVRGKSVRLSKNCSYLWAVEVWHPEDCHSQRPDDSRWPCPAVYWCEGHAADPAASPTGLLLWDCQNLKDPVREDCWMPFAVF